MRSLNYNNSNFYKYLFFFLILYTSLIIGFSYNENSTGGAFLDYTNQKIASESFSLNFKETFLTFDQFSTRHSPILIIFLSLFEKLKLDDYLIRLIHLHLCIFLPLIFFILLKKKYDFYRIENFLFLSTLIFLSPTFRSLAIWPDSKILGLIIFCVSIYFYLEFEKNKKFKYSILNIIFCSISSYISPNFAVFAVFYFFKFFLFYKNQPLKYICIITLNLILALPAFFYIFILDVNFLSQSAVVGIDNNDIFFTNFFNNFLLISSIIFFYLLPFLLIGVIRIDKLINYKVLIFSLILCLVSIYFFDYKYEFTGGGIFFKFSHFFLKNGIFFYVISFFSIYIIILVSNGKFHNILLFILIFLNNPQMSVYHKYYDPLLLIVFFTLFQFNINLSKLDLNYNKFFIYFFFISFLIINNFKYLWII